MAATNGITRSQITQNVYIVRHPRDRIIYYINLLLFDEEDGNPPEQVVFSLLNRPALIRPRP